LKKLSNKTPIKMEFFVEKYELCDKIEPRIKETGV